MTWQPVIAAAPCPACGSEPEVKARRMFSAWSRMECKCGVCGPWVQDQPFCLMAERRRYAIAEWEKVAGKWPYSPPPPKPKA